MKRLLLAFVLGLSIENSAMQAKYRPVGSSSYVEQQEQVKLGLKRSEYTQKDIEAAYKKGKREGCSSGVKCTATCCFCLTTMVLQGFLSPYMVENCHGPLSQQNHKKSSATMK